MPSHPPHDGMDRRGLSLGQRSSLMSTSKL
jgi:hypothetical protein